MLLDYPLPVQIVKKGSYYERLGQGTKTFR